MKLSDLKPNPANPRKIEAEKLKTLRRSLDEFGDLSGFVFNETTRQLVGGHQRQKVLPDNCEIFIEERFTSPSRTGTTAIGHVVVDGEKYAYRQVAWDETKEMAANIAANKHGGEWDEPKLADWLLDLDQKNYDLDLTGFSSAEIEDICAPFRTMPDEDEDAVPPTPKIATTKRGELWLLGNHRLLIDDCTVKENVERLMQGEKADMVFTDPPYNLASHSTKMRADVSASMNDLKNSQWDKDFRIEDALATMRHAVKGDFTAFIWTSQFLIQRIWDFFSDSDHVSYLVWNKPNPGPSLSKRHPTFNTELCAYVTEGSKRPVNFPLEGHFLSCRTVNVLHHSQFEGHVAQKPLELIEPLIGFASNTEQIVLDLFLGSGSTLIACEKTNRKCYGMEIEPLYGDVILARWAKFTGKDPVREDGAKWSELCAS